MPAMTNLLGRLRFRLVATRWRAWQRYRHQTRRPAVCLAFVLPLAAIYELGALWVAGGRLGARELLVPRSIREVLAWFGFQGFWLPALALVVSLLMWHRIRRDRWQVPIRVVPLMGLESLLLALPLVIVSALFPPRVEAGLAELPVRLVNGLGAGVYEELVFRLLLISGLTWLLGELLEVRGAPGRWTAAAIAALIFSGCHFAPLGGEPFRWGAFWFRAVAGMYLAVLYFRRGLGISTGAHAAYNLLLVGWHGTSW
jgi:hypothetical protein